MQKANDVNSRNRRAFLSAIGIAIPAVAITTAGSVATTAAAETVTDPVYAAIEAHRAADEASVAALMDLSAAERAAPQNWIFWEDPGCFFRQEGLGWYHRIEEGERLAEQFTQLHAVVKETRATMESAWNGLVSTAPTTKAGLIAMYVYLASNDAPAGAADVGALAESIAGALHNLAHA
jgi:hypothetical protein